MTVVLIVTVVNSFLCGGSCGGGYGAGGGCGCGCGCSVGAVTLAGLLDSFVSIKATDSHSLTIYIYDMV